MRSHSALILSAGFLVGCAARPGNPSFPVSVDQARAALTTMQHHPKTLDRPLVILGGFNDPGLGGAAVGGEMRRLFRDRRIIQVSFFFCGSFDACRKSVIQAVEQAFPNDNPSETTEVDVIGLSMGGVVGRYCAAPLENQRRLNVRRLFTVSSPHRGAVRAAELPPLIKLQVDLCPGSEFLTHLVEIEQQESYDLIPYVRLDDRIVGPANAAPAGRTPWWVPNEPMQSAHIGAAMDKRILADIARRLRDEKPFTREPAAPL
jgi:pimeloyl-ACP methyl ester carboxylesterase